MLVLELDQVEIDHCSACGGVWLDSGELEIIIGESSTGNSTTAVFRTDSTRKERKIRCPKCGKKMEKGYWEKVSDILLDHCRQGHGIWLDKGELNILLHSRKTDIDNRISTILRGIFKKGNKTDNSGD